MDFPVYDVANQTLAFVNRDEVSALESNLPSIVVSTTELGAPNGGGRLASRLIQDWFAGILQQNGPPTECSALRAFPPLPNAGPEHDLVIIWSQSYDEAHDPEALGRVLLSCMCRYCRYHFVFKVTPGGPGGYEDNTAHLQHHLLEHRPEWYDLDAAQAECDQSTKLRPLRGRVGYVCSLCNMTVELEITFPRLKPEWIQMIMDQTRIKESLRIAREEDPERYKDTTPEKEKLYMTTALSTLNQYLKNILNDDGTGSQKRISCRNKTFLIQFGPACNDIFRHLGFKEEYDEDTLDTYWVPPRLSHQEGKTPLASPRAFYEDVRSEVQSVLDDKPPMDGPPVVRPISARDQLEKALGCDKVPCSVSALPVDNNEWQHFWTLGAPVSADDAMLKFAYRRQTETDPEHVLVYLGALGSLAGRRGEELQMFVFNEQGRLEEKQKKSSAPASGADPIERAYAHFGLSRNRREPPSFFIGVYKNYREQSPAQKADHRRALALIALDQGSTIIREEVYNKDMELSEACDYLGVQPEWPLDNIGAAAQSVASEMDESLVLLALRAIASSRPPDDPNLVAFHQIVAELESSRNPISTGPSHPPSSSGKDIGAVGGAGRAVDMDIPVGLANLRNTCYLNSILQYFYSVNAVRDLALKSDLPVLEPTEANLRNLLHRSTSSGNSASQSGLETGRAFVGHEFTRELSTLFKELNASETSSITPRQRLANAALLRPEKLRPRSADAKFEAGSSNVTDAPPLPPRSGETPNTKAPFALMVEVEQSETASADSSQTLVNQTDGEAPLAITSANQRIDKDTAAAADHHEGEAPISGAGDRAEDGATKTSKLTVEELAAELDKPNVGSDQMDVDEVMGNAIDHLRAAFKVAHIGLSEGMRDPIEQAFFSTFIDNRKKIGETVWNRTSRSDRWVTAYPAQSGTRDLYEALTNSFDLEPLPGNLLSFTTIDKPAPHFHICIQRSDGVRKNANPIVIPETLYLDRFMDAPNPESPLFKARKRGWDIKTRLNELGKPVANDLPGAPKAEARISSKSITPDDFADDEIDGFLVIGGLDVPVGKLPSSVGGTVDNELNEDGTDLDPAIERLMEKYEVVKPETPRAKLRTESQPTADGSVQEPPSDLDEFWSKFHAEEATERDRLAAERNEIFSSCHKVAYRLHAVVCHAGATASAGHYWVWIHDFERDIWRKYNDTTVSVHPAEFVFGELNTKGEPYYLAYVRAEDVQNLVSIPRRPHQQQNEDVVMTGSGEDTAAAAHVEDVDMPPLVPDKSA
ncbi:ubiquitin-specific protease ubp2 [Madurella fahalii]|uniref:ubiquitinyl hydrolase 1 n=1 Tax=Madurella fahalii TaxID=1157608 RepID=A0ABQ0GIC2_9PEZI